MQAGVEIVDERRSQLRSTSGETNVLPRVSREEQKKKKLEDSEKYLPRGKRMVSASIQQERKKQKRKEKLLQPAKGESLSRLF